MACLNYVPELVSHSQQVCKLYKAAMRNVESYYVYRKIVRYHQVQLRALFDENRCVNLEEARKLLWLGEEKLFNLKNPLPCCKFARSPVGLAHGVAHARVVEPPDWVFDYWHPMEKALYPTYFHRRECRKKEYIQRWYSGCIC